MINNVVLTGRITKDIEIRENSEGIKYTYFTIAVNRNYQRDKTDFISCVAWRNTAELMQKYLSKGSLIGVEGRIEVYTFKDGNDFVTRTNVNVNNLTFLESKNQSVSNNNLSNSNNNENRKEFSKQDNSNNEISSSDMDLSFDDIKF